MHIRKNKVSTEGFVHAREGYFGLRDVYHYWVAYKGFVASGPDLGECIGRCYGASNKH